VCVISLLTMATMAPKKTTEKNAEKQKVEMVAAPPAPDYANFKAMISEKETDFARIQREIDVIRHELGSKTSEKDEFFYQKKGFMDEIQGLADEITRLNREKKALREGLTQQGVERRAVYAELKKTESLYQCKDEAEVDAAIERIEKKIMTSTMKLSEEKILE